MADGEFPLFYESYNIIDFPKSAESITFPLLNMTPAQPPKTQQVRLEKAEEIYPLAVVSILEGGPSDVVNQLKVAVVVMNRLNAPNWVKRVGATITEQLAAPHQFVVVQNRKLKLKAIKSFETATKALAKAKNISLDSAQRLIASFVQALASPHFYTKAVKQVGDATGFRGNGKQNSFRAESPYDPPRLSEHQPLAIRIANPI